MRKRLLWVGDAAVPTGFARVTHEILDRVRYEYDVTVMGINYRGDPYDYPYPIYAASAFGDGFGKNRLAWMCDRIKPDVIVIQQDGWQFPGYVQRLRGRNQKGEYLFPEHASIPIVAAVAVDGKNFRDVWLDGVAMAVFWTQFGLNEARAGGYSGPARVIPLGVDQSVYYPVDRHEAFARIDAGSPGFKALEGKFIVGNVNRNQPRKRWDLTLRYFAKWKHSRQADDAQLFLHVAPTGDQSVDVAQMVAYYSIDDCVAFRDPMMFYGVGDDVMRDTYNCFDVQITTTGGEGFGLTTFEGMACGVPQIVPDWSALGELCKGAASMVPCTGTSLNPVVPELNVIHGVPDEKLFIAALDALYRDKHQREAVGHLGLGRVSEERFRWQTIGDAWVELIDGVVALSAGWTDLGVPEEEEPEEPAQPLAAALGGAEPGECATTGGAGSRAYAAPSARNAAPSGKAGVP